MSSSTTATTTAAEPITPLSANSSSSKQQLNKREKSLSISVPERSYTKISPADLKVLLEEKSLSQEKPKTLLVDVRDDDYKGGNVKGCVHLPAYHFESEGIEALDKLLQQEKYQDLENIIFLSMYTSNRAPNSCSFFTQWMEKKYGDRKYKMFVLSSGFHAILKEWGSDSALIENYEPDLWSDIGMYKEDLLSFPGTS